MNTKNNTAAYISAFTAVLIWATAFSGVKYVLRYYSPEAIMLLRFVTASVTLIIISYFKKAKLPEKSDLKYFMLGGTTGIFVYMWLFNTGTNLVASGVSSFIIASSPVFSLIFVALFIKERIGPRTALGVIVSALGLAMIAISQVENFKFNLGVVILMLAAACTAIYATIQRKASEKYKPIEITTYSVIFATLLMLLFFTRKVVGEIPGTPAHVNIIVFLLGIFPGAVSYLAWNNALAKTESVTAIMNFQYLTPFMAIVLSFVLLGEVITPLAFAGGVVIIAGMIIARGAPSFFNGSKACKQTSNATFNK